jgi:hypothetical protein
MNAEAFAAASGPLLLTLTQTWLTHLRDEAETLVSEQPAWAPDALLAEAARVADQCRRLQCQLTRLDGAVRAMTLAIPVPVDPWPGAGEPWRDPEGRHELS